MSLCGIGTTIAALSYIDPRDFGLFAVASSIGLFFQQIVGAGAQESFLGRTVDEASAHAFSALTGAVSFVLLVGCAWFGFVFGWPIIGATCLAFAVTVFLWSLVVIADARATREGQGERIFVSVALGDTLSLVVTVAGLVIGWGGYALAAGKLAQGVTHFITFSALMRQAFLPSLALQDIRGYCIRFGAYCLPRLSSWADGYAADLIIGGLLSPVAAGQFRLAARFSSAFQAIITNSLNVVLLAEIGRRSHDALKAARILRISPPAVVVVGFASVAFSVVVAGTLSRFGREGWAEAAIILLWLSVATPTLVVNGAVIAHLTGQASTRRIADVQVARLILSTLGLAAGAAFGAAASAAGRSLLGAAAMVACLPRVIARRRHMRRLASPLLRQTAIALCAALLGAGMAASADGLGNLRNIAALLCFATVAQLALTLPELLTAAREMRLQWRLRSRRSLNANVGMSRFMTREAT